MDYTAMLNNVLCTGSPRESSQGKTLEVLGFRTEFKMGELFYRPGMNRKLGWIETLQMLGGVFYPNDFVLAAPKLRYPYTFEAGYGTKIGDQLARTIDQLKECLASRRAMIIIDSAGFAGGQSRPCITSYQFLVTDNQLDMVMTARSWDLVAGFLYDSTVVGLVGLVVTNLLGLTPGKIVGFAGSGHVYIHDIEEGRIPEKNYPSKIMSINQPLLTFEATQQLALSELARFRSASTLPFIPSFINIEKLE